MRNVTKTVLLAALFLGVAGSCFAECRNDFGIRVCLPDSPPMKVVRSESGELKIIKPAVGSDPLPFVVFGISVGQSMADKERDAALVELHRTASGK